MNRPRFSTITHWYYQSRKRFISKQRIQSFEHCHRWKTSRIRLHM